MGAAPLWTAKCTYLTDTGTIYAGTKHVHKDIVINRFFGIFFMFFQSGLDDDVVEYERKMMDSVFLASIWGNLISYFILKPEEVNGTLSSDIGKYDKCGVEFSEQEYKGAEVINQIERRTVGMT